MNLPTVLSNLASLIGVVPMPDGEDQAIVLATLSDGGQVSLWQLAVSKFPNYRITAQQLTALIGSTGTT